VDRIAIKRPRERTRNNRFYAQTDDRGHRLLARAAATEVATGDENIKLPQLCREAITQHLESVFGEFIGLDVDQVPSGNDDVGVNVVSEFVNFPLKWILKHQISLGSEITPLIADAASVAGLHK